MTSTRSTRRSTRASAAAKEEESHEKEQSKSPSQEEEQKEDKEQVEAEGLDVEQHEEEKKDVEEKTEEEPSKPTGEGDVAEEVAEEVKLPEPETVVEPVQEEQKEGAEEPVPEETPAKAQEEEQAPPQLQEGEEEAGVPETAKVVEEAQTAVVADDAGAAQGQADEEAKTAYESLGEAVKAKLDEIYSSGVCSPGDIDVKCLQDLQQFEEDVALSALSQFAGYDLSQVRNKSAYLSGVMTRVRREMSSNPEKYDKNIPRAENGMIQTVHDELQKLYDAGHLRYGDIDERCTDFLRGLPESVALSALQEVGSTNIDNIRNKSAYVMSICRRHSRGPEAHGGGYGGGTYGSYGGSYGQQAYYGGSAAPGDYYQASKRTRYDSSYSQTGYGGGYDMSQYGAPAGQYDYSQYGQGQYAGYGYGAAQYGAQYGAQYDTSGYGQQYGAGSQYGGTGPNVDQSAAQLAAGVRTAEFHLLSENARYLDPQLALRLQGHYDQGTFHASTFDDRVWKIMVQMVPDNAAIVIEEVANALRNDPSRIRNPSAYFTGAAKKFMAAPTPAGGNYGYGGYGAGYDAYGSSYGGYGGGGSSYGGYGQGGYGGSVSTPATEESFSQLSPVVLSHLEYYVQQGMFQKDKFDDRALSALRRLSDEQATAVLDEIGRTDTSRLRNFSAYLMGICRKLGGHGMQ